MPLPDARLRVAQKTPAPEVLPVTAIVFALVDANGRVNTDLLGTSPRFFAVESMSAVPDGTPVGTRLIGADGTMGQVGSGGVVATTPAAAAAVTWALPQTFTSGFTAVGASIVGPLSSPMTAAQVLGAADTITLPTTGINKALSSVAARTGLILTVGTVAGQLLCLHNINAADNLTFNATPATSKVAKSICTIPAGTALTLTWDATAALWFPENNPSIGADVQAYSALLAALAGASTPVDPIGTPAAKASNAVAVAIQIKDVLGNNVSRVQRVLCQLFDTSMLPVLVGAFTMAETGLGAEVSTSARPALVIDTNASGVATVAATDVSTVFAGDLFLLMTPLNLPGTPRLVSLSFA